MVKAIVTPHNNTVVISVPNNYIGKELEVLLYAKDEVADEKVRKTGNAAQYKGLFTKEEGEKYRQYLKQVRSEWDRDI